MLADITIEDLGVIRHASAELSSGLTVLTGETGAGKTMVVTGLRLLAGSRADASRVRTGAKKAVVEGSFLTDELSSSAQQSVKEIVESGGGSADENGEYIAARTVSAQGRSKAHLGGRSVPVAKLAEFSSYVLAIHGQNDQLRLLAPEEQRAALDRFAPKNSALLADYQVHYRDWKRLQRDFKIRTESRRELAQEVDRLQFAIDEIDEISPEAGEDEELITRIRRLQDVDSLREQAMSALTAIDGAEAAGGSDGFSETDPASTLLGQAESAVRGSEDPQLSALADKLGDITTQLGEISAELGGFLGELPADPDQLESALQRQHELKNLTRKYAPTISEVIAWRDAAEKRLASIDTSAHALEELQKRMQTAEKNMRAAAKKLSAARLRAAGELEKAVTAEIQGLAMPKARLEVAVRQIQPAESGADEVELLLAPNDAARAQPLSTAASGGELSRVMLALEVIISAETTGATMVFDEVDAGVGGRAAVEIGRRLARLAVHNQVIVVTHLPQVAAYADTHLHVAKEVTDETVTSGVLTLGYEQRVEELARMLAGLDDTETGRAHAAELLDKADQDKTTR
ncbi:DNA repair protein RecN [Corynebacterium pseudodiphtheriticum]|uniref:DNA repair protein RecN n=1 Tax=Corynebacterium pseudodiphtheriticum TaxID=37637 RepID=A0ABT7FWY9_9CORY|nr:DNA repair protein RecN [Corynebacterium pseudodiphtheriticum]MDK4243306.1 DNA repair protein RecN [Corynebacterium pseudodiphtheriticum]MDK4290479.1 DNA repair protein RecN [Corynebacterium pseudodiphtheriticum]